MYFKMFKYLFITKAVKADPCSFFFTLTELLLSYCNGYMTNFGLNVVQEWKLTANPINMVSYAQTALKRLTFWARRANAHVQFMHLRTLSVGLATEAWQLQ